MSGQRRGRLDLEELRFVCGTTSPADRNKDFRTFRLQDCLQCFGEGLHS